MEDIISKLEHLRRKGATFEEKLRMSKAQLRKLLMEWYIPHYSCSLEECNIRSTWLQKENDDHGNTMLIKTWEDLLKESNTCWVIMMKHNDDVCWFISTMELDYTLKDGKKISLYERWSLVVNSRYRWKWIASTLIAEMLITRQSKPVFSVTNKPKIKHINDKYGLTQYLPDELPDWLFSTMQNVAPFQNGDIVYGNRMFDLVLSTQK